VDDNDVLHSKRARPNAGLFCNGDAFHHSFELKSAVDPGCSKQKTQLTLWISLGTLCRIGELLQAEWKSVDLDRQTWFLPSENVKGTRSKKQDHHVFLSPFALHFIQELKNLTGDSQWCFPNKQDDQHVDMKVVSKQVGDRQARFKNRKALSRRRHDDTLVLDDGQNGDWTSSTAAKTMCWPAPG
jgi:integrase